MAVVGHISSVACPRLAGSIWEQVGTDPCPASEDLLTADSSRCKGLLPTVSKWCLPSQAQTLLNVHLISYSSKYGYIKHFKTFCVIESDLHENLGCLWCILLPLDMVTSTRKDKNLSS